MAFRTNKTPVLQKKMASGNPVTFDCALNKPLLECVVSFFATQSGSGTPSPDNVRPISGYSAINIANASEDLYHDITVQNGYLDTSGNVQASGVSSVTEYIPVVEGLVYYSYDYATVNLGPRNICIYDDSKRFVSCITYETVNKKAYFTIPSTGAYIRITIDRNYIDQHLYNGTTATINFGSTIYGGEYDARTGVLTVTHGYIEFDGSNDENWRTYSGQRYTVPVSDFTSPSSSQLANIMCDKLETITKAQQGSRTFVISGSDAGTHDFMVNVGANSYEDMITWLNTNPITVAYELATPQTIQLLPCPIDTLIGNNTIFADTGDIDLTYNDLDLAKRGSFREVFKLP